MRAFRPPRIIVVAFATLVAIVAGVAVAVGASGAPPGWLVAAAPERMQMTVQAPVTGTLAGFGVKVLLKPDSFDYTHADAQHLTFTAGDDATPLPYDVEQWDPDGTSTVWVKLPALSSAVSGLDVYFGSGAPANASSPAAVWDRDYLAVNHFTTLKDSTANGFDGTLHGTNELGLAGENGGQAVALNGTDGDVDFGATMGAPVANYTFSTTVNVTAAMLTDGAYHQVGGRDQYSGAHAGEQFSMLVYNGHVYASQPGKATSQTGTASTVTAGWHTFTQTFDGSALRLYIDGALAETASGAPALPASGTFLHFLLGTYTPNDGSTTHTPFTYDEFRLSQTPRSADWIKAEYLSQTGKLVTASHYQTQDDVPGTDPTPTPSATPTGTPPANWQVPAARQRLQIAIKAPGVGSAVTNFPLLVQFGTGNFDYGDAAPDHLLFVTDDDETPLPYEIERWNTRGTSSVWVKVPSLSATASTLNLYYDGTPLNTTDAADVWDAQYASVNHFGSDEGTLADSTQNGFDGTAATGAGAYLADTGSGSYGFKLNGSGFIDFGPEIGADLTHYTYSATVDVTPTMASSSDSGYHQIGGRDEYGGAHPGEQFSMLIHNGHAYASAYNVASTSTADADSAVTAGWHTFTQSYDGTTLRLYIDGTLAESVTTNKPINQADLSHFLLGAYTDGANATGFTFDEFRLSTDARSADWVKAEALAQSNQLATPAPTSQNQNGGVLLSVTSPYASDAVGSSVTLRGAVDQPATVTYKLDAGDEVSLGSVTSTFSTQLTELTDGDHHLVVTATGQGAGNTTTRTIDFTADVTGPEIVFNTPHDGQRFGPGQSIKLDVAASDPSGVQSTTLTLDGTAREEGETVDDLAPGAHTLVATATDRLGNSTTKQIRFSTGANATFGDVTPADGTKGVDRAHATLQITPTSLLGSSFDVAFKRGYVADGRDGGITAAVQGSSTTGEPGQGDGANVVDTSGIDAAGDGSSLTTGSAEAYPYQRFTVKVPADIGSSTFTAKWSGTVPAGDRVALSVWNKTTSAWQLVGSATGDEDATSLSGDVAVADTVTDGKAQLLVQDAPAYVFGDGGATLNTAWVTDTQFYSESNPTTFNAVTQWVLDHNRTAAPAEQLSYGFLTGDIVNVAGQGAQWTNASPAMQRWDDAKFPYGIVEGNHDVTACTWTEQNGCGPSGDENSQLPAYSTYQSYFGEDRYADNPWYGGSQYDNVQHYDIVSTPKADYLFLYLDFYLTPDEITWANKVIKSHPNANVVLATHEYTNQNGSYVTEQPLDGVGIGKRIYDQIAAPNKNVVAVFSGHVWPSEHWQTKDMGNGRVLAEILYDPQSQPNQGNGWMATVGFDIASQTITKKEFSVTNPSLGNNYMGNEGQANFTIPMSVTAPKRVLATDFVSASAFGTAAIGEAHGVASGSPATVVVPASILAPGEPFAWYAEATDADGTVTRSSLYELTPATGFDSAAVLIAGTPKVGETLTADTSGFSPQADAYTYQWSVDGAPIDGATGSTLKLSAAMAGKAITVSVHATKDGYPATDVQSGQVTVVDGDVTVGQVTVSGDAQVGHTVSAKLDGWDPQPGRVDYQWLHDGADIAGATSATYDIPGADAGRALSVRITVHGAGYDDLEAVSAGVPVARGTLVAGTAPAIGGTVKVGKTVTAAPGSSSPADDGQPSYQWLLDGKELAGQTQPTYAVQPSDAHASLQVRVTYHRAGYVDLAVASDAATVAKGEFTTATPAISGAVKVGQQVSAVAGAWSPTPASIDYEWLLDGKPIDGATDAMHVVGASELGHQLSVTVHVHATGYDDASATSGALTVAAGTLQATTDPTMRGTFGVGATVEAVPGTWSHEARTTGYQWLLDDQPIPGATSSTYTLPEPAAGHWLSVQVKAEADGYAEAVATSQRMSVAGGAGGPGSTETSADTGVTGAVPATLALTLGAPASFGRFTPGVEKDYTAGMSASVVSTAGDAVLSVSDPGHLSNGAFSLASPLQVSFAPASWSGPISNATVAITLAQHIGAGEKLRTGTYAKTLTFTLSTKTP